MFLLADNKYYNIHISLNDLNQILIETIQLYYAVSPKIAHINAIFPHLNLHVNSDKLHFLNALEMRH